MKNIRNNDVSTQEFRSRTRCRSEILTSLLSFIEQNQSTTWLCLDGPLTPSWADNFTSVLDSNRVLQLLNGDKLYLSDNVKLLFETDNLSQASPAIVARAVSHIDDIK